MLGDYADSISHLCWDTVVLFEISHSPKSIPVCVCLSLFAFNNNTLVAEGITGYDPLFKIRYLITLHKDDPLAKL